MRHLWESYGLAHFCTLLMSYDLCVIRKSRGKRVIDLCASKPSDDVFEALPKSVRPSPTSVCSVTESAGQEILRIALLD